MDLLVMAGAMTPRGSREGLATNQGYRLSEVSRRWSRTGRSAEIFHDIEPGAAPVGAVAKAVPVDEHVGRVQHDRSVRPGIDELLRRRGHARADLDRPERIGDVIDPDAGVLIGGEDQRRALKRAGPVLVDIVGTEMAADRDI